MKLPMDRETDRSSRIEYVSTQLPQRATALSRLLAKQVNSELSRTEAIVLNTLRDGPRRITELAELEGLAQPTTTPLVKRREGLGLVGGNGRPTTVGWCWSCSGQLEFRHSRTSAVNSWRCCAPTWPAPPLSKSKRSLLRPRRSRTHQPPVAAT
jgi:hypothetical protein